MKINTQNSLEKKGKREELKQHVVCPLGGKLGAAYRPEMSAIVKEGQLVAFFPHRHGS